MIISLRQEGQIALSTNRVQSFLQNILHSNLDIHQDMTCNTIVNNRKQLRTYSSKPYQQVGNFHKMVGGFPDIKEFPYKASKQ